MIPVVTLFVIVRTAEAVFLTG